MKKFWNCSQGTNEENELFFIQKLDLNFDFREIFTEK